MTYPVFLLSYGDVWRTRNARTMVDVGRVYEPIAALLPNLYEDEGNPSDAASRASSPVRGASPWDGGRWTLDDGR